MSMLAEPRRKQKVINLRAKNNAWSNDSTKFGQRMLEKMGWSSGKGLGAKENGIVEHVVARYKNDEKGLGFEDRNDQWTKHEDDFNSLLANLSNAEGGTETLPSGISLEKKSKKSKARIHYHKFTRGKDLSRYSEKDLANIFGKKSFKEPEVAECIKEDTLKPTDQVFTERGNMDAYFKTKLEAIKSKQLYTDTNSNSQDNQESDYAFQGFSNTTELESNQTGFGFQPFSFYNSLKEDVSQNIELTCTGDERKSKKKKKSRQKEISSEENIIDRNNLPQSNPEVTPEMMDVPTKVKKSKKKLHIKCNEETQLLYRIDSSKCLQDVGVESTKVTKSKKKKHKECIKEIQSSDYIGENSSEYSQIQSKKSSKKSKKKKHQESFEEEIQQCKEISQVKKNKNKSHADNVNQNLSTEDSVPKKKKKRKIQDNKL